MARRRRADSAGGTQQQIPMTIPRRRSTLRELQASNNETDVVAPKVINAAPSLEKAEMYGTLMTFVQFFFVAVTGYISQFDRSRPPLFLTPNRVPNGEVDEDIPSFNTGLIILFIAQVLSAIMGLYTEETYKEYGPHWKENLFYSHLLALPLFAPFLPSMHRQLLKLASSTPLTLPILESLQSLPSDLLTKLSHIYLPSQLVFLAMNVLTQYACIRGVNLLAAASSALTVTIVLNVRKLISLLLSIWLFGNRLSPGTLVGACLVFFAGGLYSLDGGKKKGANRHKSTSNGKVG
ncbi:hypothetical protein SS1G_03743 [Sclerotinia sclerotiorum 1980 UF-70]|uniref:Uncharacterized protein n=1 Tax=Sclerotinia sclerotiorum (strain ATCC 18683 / 1980 / Ss-1) TaxID=665079 RepID=A7EEK3_SCLS1|nr:hypothetical protein SS1G_03743 [Sclerotinia sclerotiorum 1980 UF-70]EDO01269.1 hypothetical protein SS1G_03743 [Sclerotinia sclerotiorum 1980 UF-70]